VFATAIDRCAGNLAAKLGEDLRRADHPAEAVSEEDNAACDRYGRRLSRRFYQSIRASQLWMSFGVQPKACWATALAHSMAGLSGWSLHSPKTRWQ